MSMKDVRAMVDGTASANAAPQSAPGYSPMLHGGVATGAPTGYQLPRQGGIAPSEPIGYAMNQSYSAPRDTPVMGVPPQAAPDPMGAFAPLEVNMQEAFPTHQTPPHPGSHHATPVPRAPDADAGASKAITGGGESTGGFLSSRFGRYALLAALVAALVFTMRTVSTLLARRRPGRDPMQDFGTQGGVDDGEHSEAGSEATVIDAGDIEDPPSPPRKAQRKRRGKKGGGSAKAKTALFTVPDDDVNGDDGQVPGEAPEAPAEVARETADAAPAPDPMFLPLKKQGGE